MAKTQFLCSYLQSLCKFGLYVCLFPINVKTAEPIGPQLCVATKITPAGKEFMTIGQSKFNIFARLKMSTFPDIPVLKTIKKLKNNSQKVELK